MTLGALALLLTAALLHAGWNLQLKRSSDRQLAIWWAMMASSVCALPLILFGLPLPGRAWAFAAAVPYTALVFALTTLAMAPFVLLPARGRNPDRGPPERGEGLSGPRRAWAAWRAGWQRMTLIGLMSLAAYVLVLVVYSIAPVSYAGAIREVSIVFAALAGWRWLGEGFGRRRLAGSTVIFAGIVIIALA